MINWASPSPAASYSVLCAPQACDASGNRLTDGGLKLTVAIGSPGGGLARSPGGIPPADSAPAGAPARVTDRGDGSYEITYTREVSSLRVAEYLNIRLKLRRSGFCMFLTQPATEISSGLALDVTLVNFVHVYLHRSRNFSDLVQIAAYSKSFGTFGMSLIHDFFSSDEIISLR